jgi:cytochrome P450
MLNSDLQSPEFLADPYPLYARLREAGPVASLMPGAWLVTRYAEADRLLRDPRLGKAFLAGVARRYGPEATGEPLFQVVNRFMLLMNPPEHTRLRTLVSKAFSARQAPDLRRLARQEAERLVDGFIDQGRADLVTAFAYPLPIRVICTLLDLSLEHSLEFQEETQALAKAFELSPISRAEIDAGNRAAQVFDGYFREVCRERRRNPGPDLISLLLRAEEGDQRLTEDEIIANITLLFVAGHETTANMVGNALLSLFRHPDQLALLRSRPELLPRAVDEALRYESSVQVAARTAMQDVDVGGVTLRQGEGVYVYLGATNRDPAVFEAPDEFRIERPEPTPNPLSFGGGAHYCLGARLARIELETALETLFRRLPELRLKDIDNPRWKPTLTIRGLASLEATW